MSANNEKITWALESLLQGLSPYVESELKTVFQDRWADTARESFRKDRGQAILHGETLKWDAHSVLTVMWDQWNRVFRHKLGFLERSLVSELREYRNKWAHQTNFDFDDEYRILDSIERLLNAVRSELAEEIGKAKKDLLRLRFSEEAREAYCKAQVKKRKWQDIAIYGACCASINFVIFQQFGVKAWFFAIFNVFVFAYLGYQRVASPPPVYYGPHECEVCNRIIYGDQCPYCVTKAEKKRVVEISQIEEKEMLELTPAS